jgi:hypothetical protein
MGARQLAFKRFKQRGELRLFILKQPAQVFSVFLRPVSIGYEPVSACAEKLGHQHSCS